MQRPSCSLIFARGEQYVLGVVSLQGESITFLVSFRTAGIDGNATLKARVLPLPGRFWLPPCQVVNEDCQGQLLQPRLGLREAENGLGDHTSLAPLPSAFNTTIAKENQNCVQMFGRIFAVFLTKEMGNDALAQFTTLMSDSLCMCASGHSVDWQCCKVVGRI